MVRQDSRILRCVNIAQLYVGGIAIASVAVHLPDPVLEA